MNAARITLAHSRPVTKMTHHSSFGQKMCMYMPLNPSPYLPTALFQSKDTPLNTSESEEDNLVEDSGCITSPSYRLPGQYVRTIYALCIITLVASITALALAVLLNQRGKLSLQDLPSPDIEVGLDRF